MGRAMLIICSAVLISMGFIGIGTSNQGKLLTEKVVNYADFTIAKNAAHTAIQIAMQKTNADDEWPNYHDTPDNAWTTTIQGVEVALYTDYNQDPDYWEPDSLRLYSFANHQGNVVQVISFYEKAPFSTLVPAFGGALQFPTGYGSITANGAAHGINGIADHCEENKPAIVTSDELTKAELDSLQASGDLNVDSETAVDSTLNYEPTDELIERLLNSGNATTVNSDYAGTLGTASEPGVFFIDGNVKLTGQQSEGYGIMVIQNSAYMQYEDETGTTVDIRGNFQFNGLVIFENASLFEGGGTPTINGSVLVGETSDNVDPIDITLDGNININYDCNGENYAKMAAADAVKQNKYSRIVTRENVNYVTSGSDDQSLIDKIKSLL